jgi:hypothetical protein
MAIHSAVLLTDENRQLRAENERQKKKRAKRRSYIAQGGVLTVKAGLNRLQEAGLEYMEGSIDQPAQAQTRAPRMCSIYRSPEHTARTCSQRGVSN